LDNTLIISQLGSRQHLVSRLMLDISHYSLHLLVQSCL